MTLEQISIRRLPATEPPIGEGGGRIWTDAGELAQIVNGEEFAFLAYIEFLSEGGAPRGNHYHSRKTETLYVVKGSLRAVYRDIDVGTTKEILLTSGDLVTIPPKLAHVYHPQEYSQVLELADRPYDADETVSFEVDR